MANKKMNNKLIFISLVSTLLAISSVSFAKSLRNLTWCPVAWKIKTTQIPGSVNAIFTAEVGKVDYEHMSMSMSYHHAKFNSATIINNGKTLQCVYSLGGESISIEAGSSLSSQHLSQIKYVFNNGQSQCSGSRSTCAITTVIT